MSEPELWVCQLGLVDYAEAVEIQRQLRDRRQADELPDVLLALEHPPVYTRGRRTEPGELPFGEAHYRERGIDVVDTDRGGKVTYHGPGQLVGYPIMRVRGVRDFVATMERAMIAALADAGVAAELRDGLTGVWAPGGKIGSIGVHIERGVSMHGFAVNVENDLEPFGWIVPCGLAGVAVTSVAREGAQAGDCALRCFRRRMAHRFAQAHGRRQRLVSPARIGIAHAPSPRAPSAVS
ncbi:MAG TPA: lipoyl(octanoyl) transferase LipB [Solirubrobacteraceae bacterium]|jgi:lipoyl(octanoyl) transferase|nr:lipoyl(octanoyl) transferase LipB [Solirubrobacteraceae bacterium]